MYYYFKTVEDKKKSKIRVNALPGQKLSDGTPVDENLMVSCPTEIRSKFPIGTIFVSDALNLSFGKKYYTTKNFRRLDGRMRAEIAEYDKTFKTTFVDPMKESTILSKIMSDTKLVCPSSKKDGFYMSSNDWNLLVRNIKKHVNTLIVGPTGSGKTSCVKEVCTRLDIPLHVFDMGSIIDPISSLLGVHRLEGGKSIFDYAKFTQVIQEPCVILLDELNRAALSSNNVLFPCLDDRRTLSIEVAGGKDIREIKIHPEVTFIATANVGSEYSGTNQMDRALVNRFFPLELGCIPSTEEKAVLCKRTGLEEKDSEMIVKVANNIRSLYNKQEISSTLSIRETLMVANLVVDGWDLGKAMEMIYLPLYEGTTTDGERSTIYKTISSY
ncbi:MAG: AAA family ATPase [Bacilli bacterium]|nr:AAA family ATPase [Bacilli bacterium]